MGSPAPSYPLTQAALAAYDEEDAAFHAWLQALPDAPPWDEAERSHDALDAAAHAVSEAWATETADRWPWEVAVMVRPGPWLRAQIGGAA